jgi:hypothetical protein
MTVFLSNKMQSKTKAELEPKLEPELKIGPSGWK